MFRFSFKIFFSFAVVLGLFAVWAGAWPAPTSATLAAEETISGKTIQIEPAGRTNWSEMLAYEKLHPPVDEPPTVVPYMPPPPPREIPGIVAPPSLGETPGTELLQAPNDLLSPPGLVNNFLGLDDNNTSIPPDTMGAVGPNHLMVMLNTQVRIQDKTGTTLSTVTLNTFWTAGTGLSGNPFDPHLVYDSLSGRWMATIDADAQLATSAVWFAISDTDNPTDNWTFYAFDADSANLLWADYPGFGINSTWIAITNNMFTNSGNTFSGAAMWVIDKSTALAGGALTITTFPAGFDLAGGFRGFTLQPSLTFDAAETTLYIIDGNSVSSGGVGLLRLSQITGSGPSPSWSVLPGSSVISGSGFFFTTQTYNLTQVDADQMGITTDVETNDPRLLNAVYRNGRLWTTHSGGLPFGAAADRTIVAWYEVNPGGMPTPVVQSGTVGGSSAGTHFFFPSITVNANNDMALGFSYSDATQFVEAAFTGRESTDLAGTVGTVITCKAGESSYSKFFSGTRNRWGDYSATVVDPVDDLTFWTLQEYAETNVGGGINDGRWGTWWCRAQVGNVWEGDTSTSWNDGTNWSSGAVPSCSGDAIIPITPLGGVFPTVNANVSVRDLTILSSAQLNMSANTLTVCGDFENNGMFSPTGGTVNFNGGTTQHLTATVATSFHHLTVSSGTTLVEGITADNVTINGTLTNNGRLRKSKAGLGLGATTFGITGGSINITTLGNLALLQVDRLGSAHPNENASGGGADMLDTYYTLTPNINDQSFSLEVCTSYTDAELAGSPAVSDEANMRLCRWTGSAWSCPNRSASSSTTSNTVCAAGVNTLSDWTMGELTPTALTLDNLNVRSRDGITAGLLALLLLGFTGGLLYHRKNRFSRK